MRGLVSRLEPPLKSAVSSRAPVSRAWPRIPRRASAGGCGVCALHGPAVAVSDRMLVTDLHQAAETQRPVTESWLRCPVPRDGVSDVRSPGTESPKSGPPPLRRLRRPARRRSGGSAARRRSGGPSPESALGRVGQHRHCEGSACPRSRYRRSCADSANSGRPGSIFRYAVVR